MAEPYKYRNEDGTLRLDEILGEKHVRHYTRILESSSAEFAAMQLSYAIDEAPPDVQEAWSPVYERGRGTRTPDGWLITEQGTGEPLASSCQELALLPEVCWDVCGYYRRLGVHWRATRSEIVKAQLERDPGRDDLDMSYAAAQLLDPVIRRAYDLVPLGGIFMGDRDVQERLKRAAATEASRRNAEAWWAGEDYTPQEQQEKVLREWGIDSVSDEEAAERLAGGGFRHGTSSDALGSTMGAWERYWRWYLMYDPYDEIDALAFRLPDALQEWQPMVGKALARLGLRISFSVGIWPGHGWKMWRDSNKSCIFFIGTGKITQHMADVAAEGYAAQVSYTVRNQRRQLHANSRTGP